jgi:RND family efflux transporter MFP subunit
VILTLAVGVAVALQLVAMRAEPVEEKRVDLGPLVAAEEVLATDIRVEVKGFGTVEPKVQVDLVPEVSGKVVGVHPALVDGGFFKKDEVLVQIDPTDYERALEQAQAAVERARVALEVERAEGDVAKAEWNTMNPGKEPPSPLVLRTPQIRRAEAELRAAEAQVRDAETELKRTKLTLPFNGRVFSEQVDLGQYVTPGKSIASVYGTDAVEVRVPLEDAELQWFDIPGFGEDSWRGGDGRQGAAATVVAEFAGGSHKWEGVVVRTAGRVDPRSRMVTVVVEVDQPFSSVDGRPSLVPGVFVEVVIQGRKLDQVLRIPRYALREGQTVWVAREGRLHIQQVQSVIRMDREFAYLSGDLESGAQVVTSSIDAVTDGMIIRANSQSAAVTGSPSSAQETKESALSDDE